MGRVKVRHLVTKPQKGGHVLYYWQPSKALRATGHFITRRLAERTGRLADAIREAEALNAEVDAWRSGASAAPTQPDTIPGLVKLYRSESIYTRLAEKTRREYDAAIRVIEKWSTSVADPPVSAIERSDVRTLARQMEATPSKARAVMAVLRILLNVAVEEGFIEKNPAVNLRLPKPKARRVVWTDEQIETLCKTAEKMGHPSIALAVKLGANLGQREGDVIALSWSQFDGTAFLVRQRKTDALVAVRVSADLHVALARAPRTSPVILVSEGKKRPYRQRHFCRMFEKVREEAKLPPGLWFLDLRRTAVVRLAEAGCTVPEIAAITGHDLNTTVAILETYLPRNATMAAHGIAKLDEYRKRTKLEGAGGKSEG